MISNSNITAKDLVEKDIFLLMGLAGIPEEKKTEMRDKFGQIIENNVMVRLSEELKAKKLLDSFEKLSSDEEIESFFKENQIDVGAYYFDEAIRLKAMFAAVLGAENSPSNTDDK